MRLDDDPVLSVDNLNALKDFILARKRVRTFCNMYNGNPWLETEHFDLYLLPDAGGPHGHPQWNINCDPTRGDFRRLVIRRKHESDDQYRELDFSSGVRVEMDGDIDTPWPREAVREALLMM
jgi:hypothetical protein